MFKFYIHPDSDTPASNQLYNQIRFAVASRQFPPGHKLPSTRQLAMQTGLHRNTISKVYRQLEEDGVVLAQAGSGIYVRDQGGSQDSQRTTPLIERYPDAYRLVRQSVDEMLKQQCSLNEARELFLAEIDWRLRCSARVLVTVPKQDLGAGELMVQELEQSLHIPVQLVPLEELETVVQQTRSGTVVTSRYFSRDAETVALPHAVRVIAVDIYDYAQELTLISKMKPGSCVGLVSLSSGILRAAEVLIHSLRGEELLLMTCQPDDRYRLEAVARGASTILADRASFEAAQRAVRAAQEDLIRAPQMICCNNYIDAQSIQLLKLELGLE
ncbi:GntR family transcriptional regulator [Prochlorothrix hollandica]|uniref:GntR family transcriptional regulator n=1 Tax=Prochlorothrix hollandica PCC 9006 = CALU 1027 TaxID=317619 RepID=A0A0M2PTV0_PROHO|nr:GntR family transcriptional regulator [Prochlorothrix hollandica]KKI99930.1 GntR family transcriptional regulator [Prochlorothrix hollandica PCC 9006 = CALU 1027]